MDWIVWSLPVIVLQVLFVVVVCALLAAIVCLSVEAKVLHSDKEIAFRNRAKIWVDQAFRGFGLCFGVGLFGGLAGDLGGGSRVGVAGDLVPAMFVLIGGYTAYLFREKAPTSVYLFKNLFAFIICFFVLYNASATLRQDAEAFEFCKKVYSDPDFAKDIFLVDQRNSTWKSYCLPVIQRWTK